MPAATEMRMPLVVRLRLSVRAFVGDTVHDDRCGDQRHAGEDEERIAFCGAHVIDRHAQHQSDAYADGKGDRKSRECDGRGEEEVGGVEDHAADEGR